jgi:hypothetical protein
VGRGRERLGIGRVGRVATLYSVKSGRATQQARPTSCCVNGPIGAVLCWAGPNGPIGPAVIPHQAAHFGS